MKDLQNSASTCCQTTFSEVDLKILEILFKSYSDIYLTFDRVTNWLLTGTGAAAVLLVSNADTIFQYRLESSNTFFAGLSLLTVSCFFGFFAKFYFFKIEVARKMTEAAKEELETLFKEENAMMLQASEFHCEQVLQYFIKSALPGVMQNSVERQVLREIQNKKLLFELPSKLVVKLAFCCALQIILFLTALICFTFIFWR